MIFLSFSMESYSYECCVIISECYLRKMGIQLLAKNYIMSAATLYKHITHTLHKQTLVS